MFNKYSESEGFTLVELMMVICIMGILMQIAIAYLFDFIKTARDSTVRSDVANIMTIVVGQFANEADVNYAAKNDYSIGIEDTSGNSINATYSLSPNVVAVISPGSSKAPGQPGFFDGTFYHRVGSADPTTLSGVREFYLFLDESTSTFEVSF